MDRRGIPVGRTPNPERVFEPRARAATRASARTRLLETGKALFYQRGIRAVSVDDIVEHAGLSKPSLYRNFASKDELAAACLDEIGEEGMARLDAHVAAAGEDPASRLRALVGFCAGRIAEAGFRGSPMSNMAVEFPEADHPGRAVASARKAELHKRVADMARQTTTDEPEALADGLMLLIEGAFSLHHLTKTDGPANALRRAADLLIDASTRRE